MIFVDADVSTREQVEALAVQASLLAAGSLHPDVVRRLTRGSALARRYLAVEGHRALAAIEDLLPQSLRSLIDSDVAARADSPAASLDVALSRESITDPPRSFGIIRARQLLASINRADSSPTNPHAAPEERHRISAEVAEDGDDGAASNLFASPVGGGGVFGRWLGQLLEMVRQLNGGNPAAAAAPTDRTRAGARAGSNALFSTSMAGTVDDAGIGGRGTKYPEWNVHSRSYRRNWCTVQEVEPQLKENTFLSVANGYGLRRSLARLGMGLDRCRRRVQGDDLDIDAVVEARVAAMAGTPDDAIYVESLRRRRDLAVLVLLDTSGSAAEPGAMAETVHEQQRAAAAALTVALHDLGDRVALYAYHSRGRSAVHLVPVKRFDDDLNPLVMRRLHSLVPGAYSRLGAAIRHGAAVLEKRGGTSRRLLVVLSDGLAYDHGYEPVYGAADARRALAEARHRGTACLCLTIGASTDVEILRRVFGSAAHATIPRTHQMSQLMGPLFRSALRSAEVRRRVSS